MEGCTCHRETFKTSADRGRILKTRGAGAASELFKESRSFTHLLKHYKNGKNFFWLLFKGYNSSIWINRWWKNNKNIMNSYNKLYHSKNNERKDLNNLNYRVTSTQQRFTHCFLEQIYHRLHAQLITGTKTHLSVEQCVLLACFPLRHRRNTSFQQQWLLWFSK